MFVRITVNDTERDVQQEIWLATDYHFPSTYSCRIPLSNPYSALALPAPGPATVRLAFIRTAIELYGVDFTREALFPTIRSMNIAIRPPAKVALSHQRMRLLKIQTGGSKKDAALLSEGVGYREMAHATGLMTVYIRIAVEMEAMCRKVLATIGYWGQTNSLTSCINIYHAEPIWQECAKLLDHGKDNNSMRDLFSSVIAEFRSFNVRWEAFIPETQHTQIQSLQLKLCVWPMEILEQKWGAKILVRRL